MTNNNYYMTCPTCGKLIDKRNLGQVLSHGRFNPASGNYECRDEKDAQFSTARKVGESKVFTKDGREIDLN
jgi:hypothetical protein